MYPPLRKVQRYAEAARGPRQGLDRCDTRTAHDGVEAYDVAAEFRPDVALLDIGMPRLNGHDTARRIRAQPWGESMVLVALDRLEPERGPAPVVRCRF